MTTERYNLDSAISRAEAELSRLAACDDCLKEVHETTAAVVAEVTQKLGLVARRSTDGTDKFLNVGELLIRLKAERSLCEKLSKHARATSLRRMHFRESAGVHSTAGVDNSINRLIAAILVGGNDEFIAQGQVSLCAELVSALSGDGLAALDLNVWTTTMSSSQDVAYPKAPKELDLNKLSALHAALPRLIEERVSTLLGDGDNFEKSCVSPKTGKLPKDLAERVLLSARLDAKDARVCSDILKLLASFNKRLDSVRQLLGQNDRLCNVEDSKKTYQLRFDDVLNAISRLRSTLALQQNNCKSLAAESSANARLRGGDGAATVQKEEAKGAVLEERCRKLLITAGAQVDTISRMEDRKAVMHASAECLAAQIIESCGGSPETWCRNLRAAVHRDKKTILIVELFKEFHNNPTRFSKRMQSAMRSRGALNASGEKPKDSK